MTNEVNYKILQQRELIQIISDCINKHGEQRFCFILGAGASQSSGIPTADSLSKLWIDELMESNPEVTQKWLLQNSRFMNFDLETILLNSVLTP